jgi:hypothetical protein
MKRIFTVRRGALGGSSPAAMIPVPRAWQCDALAAKRPKAQGPPAPATTPLFPDVRVLGLAYKLRRKLIIAVLTSGARSCWVQ